MTAPLAGRSVTVVGVHRAPDTTGIAPYTTGLCRTLVQQGASAVDVCLRAAGHRYAEEHPTRDSTTTRIVRVTRSLADARGTARPAPSARVP